MQIDFSTRFIKMYKKSPEKIKKAFHKKRGIFLKDRYSQILNNHKLTGRLNKYRSINITGDWRVIFEEIQEDDLVIFHLFGTHSQLYK